MTLDADAATQPLGAVLPPSSGKDGQSLETERPSRSCLAPVKHRVGLKTPWNWVKYLNPNVRWHFIRNGDARPAIPRKSSPTKRRQDFFASADDIKAFMIWERGYLQSSYRRGVVWKVALGGLWCRKACKYVTAWEMWCRAFIENRGGTASSSIYPPFLERSIREGGRGIT